VTRGGLSGPEAPRGTHEPLKSGPRAARNRFEVDIVTASGHARNNKFSSAKHAKMLLSKALGPAKMAPSWTKSGPIAVKSRSRAAKTNPSTAQRNKRNIVQRKQKIA